MTETVFCLNCGTPISDLTQPCPQCGSIARGYGIRAESGHYSVVGGDTTLVYIPYQEKLLATAKKTLKLLARRPAN